MSVKLMADELSPDEKQQIADVLNREYQTTLPVDVLDVAVDTGFTTWAILKSEAANVASR